MDRLYVGAVVIDVDEIAPMRAFWKDALGYEVDNEADDWVKLSDPGQRGASVSLQQVPEPRRGKNRLHLDLYARDQMAEVERLERLGATRVRGPEPEHDFVVLADPEGNLFCVIDVADTG